MTVDVGGTGLFQHVRTRDNPSFEVIVKPLQHKTRACYDEYWMF